MLHQPPSETVPLNLAALLFVLDYFPRRNRVSSDSAEVLTCAFCNRIYRSPQSLANHMKSHSGKTTCAICNKIFATVNGLKSHMISFPYGALRLLILKYPPVVSATASTKAIKV
nr:PREDICTED: uncharacterized protein LOC109043429 [Bemisia tabaci]